MKRFLIAPDSFKESLSAKQAAEAIGRGIRRVLPEAQIDLCPVADGGEGTVEAMICSAGGTLCHSRVIGPLGEVVTAAWGKLDDGQTAVIEMAQAAGLPLIPLALRNPMLATTFGVGEQIRIALDSGVKKILIGIGGSATTDGGTGMAQALGARFPGVNDGARMCGGLLEKITRIDLSSLDRRLKEVELVAACDVTSPLTGPQGAAAVYGPQKGATPKQVEELDRGLVHLARCLKSVDPQTPGSGAAGGMGWGLMAFCGARMRRGIDLVLDAVRFSERVQTADLVFTGEGRLDGQSLHGKTCMGVARAAGRYGKPVIALVGSAGPGAEKTLAAGLSAYEALCRNGISVEEAIRRAEPLMEQLAGDVLRKWL